MDYHSKEGKEILSELRTSLRGLSQEEVTKRLQKHGKNIIKKTRRLRLLKIFVQQFNSFLIYILIIAAIISFLIKHNLDAIVISAIVVLNASIGFVQQYKAEKAVLSLRKLLIPKSTVIREGKMIEVPSSQLVQGDIVILERGDKVNADCRIIEAGNLQTNEAVLTGESFPVNKFTKKISKNAALAERNNMLFTGTEIVRGSAKAIVVSTGMKTVFGEIAKDLQEIEVQKTPMQKRLDKFSLQIGFFILAFVAFILGLGLFERFDKIDMFLTAIALAVSAIPEGLPAVLTISFAISSLMMSKKNVIIRRLSAVESLGSVTVICADKTGTMTEEKMKVQKIFSNNNFYVRKGKKVFLGKQEIDSKKHKELAQLLKTGIFCNAARFEKVEEGYEIIGDPTEQALVALGLDLGFNKKSLIESHPSIEKFEFDSKRKMMSILRDNGRNNVLYSKGAPSNILKISTHELVSGEIRKLTEKRRKELSEASKEMEKDALRVLGFAYKNFNKKSKPEEKGLIFLGFTGMIDPPRKEVREAIQQCKNAGIAVKMITGDSALTAKAIAKQVGIKGRIVTESELIGMSDAELKEQIGEIGVFARVTPDQKLRITKILQKNNETVAITGDGVNDVLALKSADVGIAMGIRGSDVARDVSDIVLIDDNFASIVEGIKQGRNTYDNIKKFTKYLLAVNFSGIFLILTALILALLYGSEKWFLPLLPLQILWMNLVTDSFPALSLVFEQPENVMNKKPKKEKSLLDDAWKFILIAGALAFIIELTVYLIGINSGFSPEKTRTFVLTTAIFFELFFVYTCRSNTFLPELGIFSNKKLNYAVLLSILLHLLLLYTPFASVFGLIPLTFNDWLFILPFALSGLLLFEIGKFVRKKN